MKNKNKDLIYFYLTGFFFISTLLCLKEILEARIIYTKIAFAFLLIFSFFFLLHFVKSFIKETNKKEIESQEKLLEDLSNQYKDIVNLVKTKTEEYLEESNHDSYFCKSNIHENLQWLSLYHNKLTYISNNFSIKPYTFIQAACLITSISESFCVVIDEKFHLLLNTEFYDKSIFLLNINIAFKVALEMISTPVTYVEIRKGNWQEASLGHSNILINFPKGIIPDASLEDSIINTIYKDYVEQHPISEMQLANMLHLIYLYCKDCKKG